MAESRSRAGAPSEPVVPVPASVAETAPAPGSPGAAEVPGAEPVGLTRRERRAAARGGGAARVAGPVGHRLPPPPVRRRDYAARKHG
jgi:hypothetical protein